MKLYLAVTPDKYELPLYVTEDYKELADKYNVLEGTLLSRISRKQSGKKTGVKFISVDIGESIWG